MDSDSCIARQPCCQEQVHQYAYVYSPVELARMGVAHAYRMSFTLPLCKHCYSLYRNRERTYWCKLYRAENHCTYRVARAAREQARNNTLEITSGSQILEHANTRLRELLVDVCCTEIRVGENLGDVVVGRGIVTNVDASKLRDAGIVVVYYVAEGSESYKSYE